jgi:RNA 3'-terminal phosphate cyclase
MKISTVFTVAVILAAILILAAALVLPPIVQRVHAEEAKPGPARWAITLTVIDRTTGARLRQTKLGGTELEFDDLDACKSIVDRVHPTPTERMSAVLSCQRVEPYLQSGETARR